MYRALNENSTTLRTDTSLTQSIILTAVDLFTTWIMRRESFKSLCKSAIQERHIAQTRLLGNLARGLRLYARMLCQEEQGKDYENITQFVLGTSVVLASRILREVGAASRTCSLEKESDKKQVEEQNSMDKFAKKARAPRVREPEITMTDDSREAQVVTEVPNGISDADEESDAGDESLPEELEVRRETILDDLQKAGGTLFETHAFEVMENGLHDFVFPTLRTIMTSWILKKHHAQKISSKRRRDLEVIVSELQHIPTEEIFVTFDDDNSIINKAKGSWERFTGEIWDWRPLRPYMRPLASGEARLQWKCVRS